MLFRSAFAAAQKIGANIEHDNRHITRIIAHCWNRLSDAEKQIWRDKAAAEKAQHAERYPDYRFSPVGRAKKPKKRKVRRNGAEDVKRCETLAELVMAGKCGLALESALKKIEQERDAAERRVGTELDVFTSTEKRRTLFDRDPPPHDCETGDVAPFRSPLLPPANTTPQQVPDKNFMPEVSHPNYMVLDPILTIFQPLVITSAHHVEPQTFCSPTDTSTSDDDLQSLFHSPCYQYYQPNLRNIVPSPRSVPPAHYQSVVPFMQNSHAEPEQSVPDFTLFTWNQSDSFSYYH